jgi:hypothetical protein
MKPCPSSPGSGRKRSSPTTGRTIIFHHVRWSPSLIRSPTRLCGPRAPRRKRRVVSLQPAEHWYGPGGSRPCRVHQTVIGLQIEVARPGSALFAILQAHRARSAHDDHPPQWLTALAAGAMGAPDTGAPRVTSTHGRSIQPPSQASGAASIWLRRCRWAVRVRATADVSWQEAHRRYSMPDALRAAGVGLLHLCSVS